MEVRQMAEWFGEAESILQAKACPTELDSAPLASDDPVKHGVPCLTYGTVHSGSGNRVIRTYGMLWSGSMKGPEVFFEIDGERTLPIYHAMGIAQASIPQYGKGPVKLQYFDPAFVPPVHRGQSELGSQISKDPTAATRLAGTWVDHKSKLAYFIQFSDDQIGERLDNLRFHTELISAISDSRLHIDTAVLWKSFERILRIYSRYNPILWTRL